LVVLRVCALGFNFGCDLVNLVVPLVDSVGSIR